MTTLRPNNKLHQTPMNHPSNFATSNDPVCPLNIDLYPDFPP